MSAHAPTLPKLHVGNVQATIGPLTLYPIWTEAPLGDRRYRLPERGGIGLVTEHDEGPRVEELLLENPSDDPLLVLEGMTLDGGLQHRVLTRSILLAPHGRTTIPVRCIEQSRWHGDRSQRFSSFEAPLSMRATLRTLNDEAPRRGRRSEPDQMRVWTNVAAYETRAGFGSATHSLHEMQSQAVNDGFWKQLRDVRPLPAQRGVVVAVLGHPVLAEVTDHPDTLAERWDALLSGMALDVADVPYVPTPGRRVRAFVRKIAHSRLLLEAGAGMGVSVDADDHDRISLRGIADSDGLLHALALNRRHEFVQAA